ncbi:MAG: ChbG/HpnK family deacetylase [Desulfuromonas thiophila]|nr:ChbG/HpnK family deacetylase [Desulfuromonas thiophila]
MSASVRLIVNADDFGWAPGRDRGIRRSVLRGLVTSVSLMANGATFVSAARFVRQRQLPCGVHFNLSEGRALCGPVGGLTDAQGRFLGKQAARRRFAQGAFDVSAVERELQAQLQRLRQAGLRPDHCDTHQHWHLFPALTPLLLGLCRRQAIAAVRLAEPAEPLAQQRASVLGTKLAAELALYRQLAPALRQAINQEGLFAPDGLWGMTLLDRLNEARLVRLLQQLPEGCWELMVHPGDIDPGQPFGGPSRRREQRALRARRMRETVVRCGIQLTSFGASSAHSAL